jgi:glycine/D-amino acid oxidase-like deaminating enzyme
MDLKSGYPFWAVKNGLMQAFPPLQADVRCDVVVLGAGITGALIAEELVEHGHDVVVVDQRDVGWGSTAASTALLQYEIDTHLVDLAKRYGEDQAALAYRACGDAIDMIADKAAELRDVDFARMRSLYYASRSWHAGALRDEYELRKKHGFKMNWLERDEIDARYGFAAPAAILSHQAARIDPYRMSYKLLAKIKKAGAGVYDRSPVVGLKAGTRGVTLETAGGGTVRAGYVVVAAGYASQQYLKRKVAKNRSSYAFVTDPIEPAALGELAETMVWESARPYLYMRATGDGRLVVGGADDAIDIPARRDARVDRKASKLADKVGKLFPHIPLDPAFAWGGTFAETEDGLPWFGAHRQTGPRMLFAMAYGGNGITYSMLGAGLIRASIEKRRHPLAGIFGFER